MKKILILTNITDLSIPLYLTQSIQKKIVIDFYFFCEGADGLKYKMMKNKYDYIYIGYPFRETTRESLGQILDTIIEHKKSALIVDNIKNIDDLYFEDKWLQYKLFSKFMPSTKLLKNINDADMPGYITKERISGRAEGVYFNSKELDANNVAKYIFQEAINIKKEYRVYVVCDEIMKIATIKSPKTETTKVSVVGSEEISEDINVFMQKIIATSTFDFVGIDIARGVNGKLYLIEINRACLFNGYFKQTGINLAEILIDKIIQKY